MLSRLLGIRSLPRLRSTTLQSAQVLSATRFSAQQQPWTRSIMMTRPVLLASKKETTTKATRSTATGRVRKTAAKPKEKKTTKAVKAAKPKKPEATKEPIAILKVPKRPGQPFTLFVQRFAKGVKPREGEKPIDAGKRSFIEAAQVWRNMSEAEKQPFRDENEAAKKEFENVKQEFFANLDPVALRRYNEKRVAKGKPKLHRPAGTFAKRLTAYNMFQSNLFAHWKGEHPTFGEYSRETARRWKAMSDEEKPFHELHKKHVAEREKSFA
ncbi:unnamed protein product [Somion occarium]|uniref:HMG box domain-containing protein n=1 Tax=Somion occarium TaxID=3059160 RepID=A0ABP1E1Y5_9APHY